MSIYNLRMFTLTGVILITAAGMANAATNTSAQSTSREHQSALLDSQSQSSDEMLARDWNLSPQEWQRYQTLMQSSRGVYSPGLDPLTGGGASIDSGIASRTDTYIRTKPTKLTSCCRINRGRADPRKACSAAAYYAGTHP
ncbi:hypothetical protein ALP82_00573 [Pseudomonas savastanoi pv. fraxini]|nr:hypothetical protein ALP89_01178 [Pseudomonas syringae pv. persicae]RMR76987.1 hypothetical protein ALP82_00573 [Pseudomonas savastanoi pv. fraxini]